MALLLVLWQGLQRLNYFVLIVLPNMDFAIPTDTNDVDFACSIFFQGICFLWVEHTDELGDLVLFNAIIANCFFIIVFLITAGGSFVEILEYLGSRLPINTFDLLFLFFWLILIILFKARFGREHLLWVLINETSILRNKLCQLLTITEVPNLDCTVLTSSDETSLR